MEHETFRKGNRKSEFEFVNDLNVRFAAWTDKMSEPLWSFPAAERTERRAKRRNRNATDREYR